MQYIDISLHYLALFSSHHKGSIVTKIMESIRAKGGRFMELKGITTGALVGFRELEEERSRYLLRKLLREGPDFDVCSIPMTFRTKPKPSAVVSASSSSDWGEHRLGSACGSPQGPNGPSQPTASKSTERKTTALATSSCPRTTQTLMPCCPPYDKNDIEVPIASPDSIVPGKHDVKLGRGHGISGHTGNVLFRRICWEVRDKYCTAMK